MNNKKYVFFLILVFIAISRSFGQTNTDSIFRVAIEQAKNHHYTESINNCKAILKLNPNRTEVIVYIANVYAWDGKYDSAKIYINNALLIDKTNNGAYATWLNVLLWNKEYVNLLNTANIAEANGYENSYDLLIKRLLANKALKNYEEALLIINNSENKDFIDSSQIDNLHKEILLLSKNKLFTISYSLDFFDKNAPQHLIYLDYGLKLKKQTMILRLNYANKFQKKGIQLETDYYRSLNKGYIYLNYGYAIENALFPKHRIGAEYYFSIIKSLEGSLGGRYLHFQRVDVFISTGSITKYFGNNLVSIRPFYTFKTGSSKQSISLIGDYRRYGKNALTYWGIEFGYGNSPDDRLQITNGNENYRLQSYKVKLERNFIVGKTSEMKVMGGYSNEEYYTNKFRNRYSIEVQYKFRLK